MTRALLLFLWALNLTFWGVGSVQAAVSPVPKGDGIVRLHVFHTDEFVTVRYADAQGVWIDGADAKIAQLLRSREEGAVHAIDRRLIELADHLQEHFAADTVEVICGYRSPTFNTKLKDTGHNVAKESLHMQGMAMDIHLDEVREDVLRDYLLSLKLGGVGYYGNKLMVHMDFGPVRTWQDGGYVENTEIGVFNDVNPIKLRTDKLTYALHSLLTLRISSGAETGKLSLEKYFRGAWGAVKSWPRADRILQVTLDEPVLAEASRFASVYGKYRLRLDAGAAWQHSNEFYVRPF